MSYPVADPDSAQTGARPRLPLERRRPRLPFRERLRHRFAMADPFVQPSRVGVAAMAALRASVRARSRSARAWR